ncbi:MAG: CGLD27 family protein [Thermostichus sp. DG_1_6_bins_120]
MVEPVHPIPVEQQPLQQYEELRETFPFSWPLLEWLPYLKRILAVWGGGVLLISPLLWGSFAGDWVHFALGSLLAANALLNLLLLHLYLGWAYVRRRLAQVRIPYEESGWYDGGMYAKSEAEVAQHRLIVSYQIEPILQRLRRSFWWVLGLSGLLALGWLLG